MSRISEIVVPGQAIAHTVPQCKLRYLHGASNIALFRCTVVPAQSCNEVVYFLQQ